MPTLAQAIDKRCSANTAVREIITSNEVFRSYETNGGATAAAPEKDREAATPHGERKLRHNTKDNTTGTNDHGKDRNRHCDITAARTIEACVTRATQLKGNSDDKDVKCRTTATIIDHDESMVNA